ncbi:MAG: hypothetical protein GXX79_03925, partial [Actinomycetales bacterium]|nr:hypothetical protein [Actinomycetales bacterium]
MYPYDPSPTGPGSTGADAGLPWWPVIPTGLPTWAVLAAAALALVLIAVAGYVLGRRTRRADHLTDSTPNGTPEPGRRVETLLTLAAAGIATAVAVSGMWRVFGDVLGFTGPGRIALAGFLEIALMVSAIRARRALRDHGSVGVDGAAVWAMAVLSAILAAADATGLAKAVRFAAPLVAAWLWERGLAAERRAAKGPRTSIAWRWTRHRLAIRLGLADPSARGVDDIDRTRRLSRLTRARIRLAVLETSRLPRPLAILTGQPLRIAFAAWRLQRHALAAVEHLHLGLDPATTSAIRTTVAAVIGLREATTPHALASTSPWSTPQRALEAGHPEHGRGIETEHGYVVERGPEHPCPAVTGEHATGEHTRHLDGPEHAPSGQGTGHVQRKRKHTASTASNDSRPVPEHTPDDAEIAAEIAATGTAPSIRAIKAAYRVGNSRAARIRTLAFAHLDDQGSHRVLDQPPTRTGSPRTASASAAASDGTSPSAADEPPHPHPDAATSPQLNVDEP